MSEISEVGVAELGPQERTSDRAQYGLAALLAAVGGYTIYDATGLTVGFGDPVGPKAFPYLIGSVMLLLAVLLAVATARGDRGTAEAGEDVDLSQGADWITVLKLVGVLVFTIATIDWLGWAITGAILFAGSAWSLGSRTVIRDLIIGGVLSVGSWYAFYSGLGIALSPGILDGIL
ncbi:tripartite tricarboxylate transporter TctB family protein [Nocardioides alcanivorans]|uniref:tripartite tricarboxylate transporter TctB family protein n=1 Tax=Nocardioides alcanivorans TaxID=2897352 RepID=UPI001F1FAF91|nr:tripartite tricarboxylate transporter TctB family protein [Nocardioides alcanivorans]